MNRSFLKLTLAMLVLVTCQSLEQATAIAQDEQNQKEETRSVDEERKALLASLNETLTKLTKLEKKENRGVQSNYLQKYSTLRRLANTSSKQDRILNYYEMLPDQTGLWARRRNPGQLIANSAADYLIRLQKNAMTPSPYWIGVQCEAAEKYEFKISDSHVVSAEGGLRVNAVTAESPAESAGIEMGDIIIFLNDNPTNDIVQLVGAINESESNTVGVSIIRNQSLVNLQVTPALRKSETAEEGTDTSEEDLATGLRLNLAFENQTIPEGIEVVARFKQGSPLDVTFKNDEQEWKITGETISELPIEAQPFAHHIFKSNAKWVDAYYNPHVVTVGDNDGMSWSHQIVPNQARFWSVESANVETNTSDSKLDKIQVQLDELREAIKSLKKE